MNHYSAKAHNRFVNHDSNKAHDDFVNHDSDEYRNAYVKIIINIKTKKEKVLCKNYIRKVLPKKTFLH